MGATSVTGVGQGMSDGLQKRENHMCCGGACGTPETTTPTVVKRGCVVNYGAGRSNAYRASGGTGSTKVC